MQPNTKLLKKQNEDELLNHWDAYLQEHKAELLKRYQGKYIAVFNDKVIDEDKDLSILAERVYAQIGYKPVFFPFIQDEEPVYQIN